MMRFHCPKCRKRLNAPESAAGRKVKCPNCKTTVQIPYGDEALEKAPVQEEVIPVARAERDRAPARLRRAEDDQEQAAMAPFRPIRLALPMWLTFAGPLLIYMFIGLVGSIVAFIFYLFIHSGEARRPNGPSPILLVFVSFVALAAVSVAFLAGVLWFMIGMYRVWRHVIVWATCEGIELPVASAGLAVGLLFVPLFNVWWYWRFYGVGKYLNRVLEARNLVMPEASESIAEVNGAVMVLYLVSLAVAFYLPPEVGLVLLLFAGLFALTSVVLWLCYAHNLSRSVNGAGKVLGGVP
jgi:phage FluMu protein Com